MSMCGVNVGLFLPRSTWATRVARRPNVIPLASNRYHSRCAAASAAFGVYVFVLITFSSPFTLTLSSKYRGTLGTTPKPRTRVTLSTPLVFYPDQAQAMWLGRLAC